MDPIARMVAAGAAGASGSSATYVDDVFSTFVYDGTGSTQTINNGIDLSGEGGLVWFRNRETGVGVPLGSVLQDTERGNTKFLRTQGTGGEETSTSMISSFNSNGFTFGSDTNINYNGDKGVAWTFRKAPGFFDVVTYTGNSSNRTIAHNLGSVPGMIIVKQYDATRQWFVYHRSLGATYSMNLDSTASKQLGSTIWNNTEPTDTHFSLGTSAGLNNNNNQYIAYIFAHDDQSFGTDEDEAIIKCGSYTGNGSSTGPVIDLGFEPQFLLHKRADNSDNWIIMDTMRGFTVKEGKSLQLWPNTSSSESNPTGYFNITSNGFSIHTTNSNYNTNGETYIYMAIRRPNKPPTAGTDVFAIDTRGGTSPNPPTFYSGFPVDLVTRRDTYQSDWTTRTRLIGQDRLLQFNNTNSENTGTQSAVSFDQQNGVGYNTGVDANNYAWMFKRAPGFFDVVAYDGSGTARLIPHNLEAVPQMIIVKRRDGIPHWQHWYYSLGAGGLIQTASSTPGAAATTRPHWNNTLPTATHFSVGTDGDVNNSSGEYIAYLFGSLNGISKVGEYTGTGSNVNVDCGFSAGARFVMIKRRDGSGDFYIWDSLRGIVSGNDPYFILTSDAAAVTNTDYIDPLNTGFTVTSSAPAALNASGGTYLFFAIA